MADGSDVAPPSIIVIFGAAGDLTREGRWEHGRPHGLRLTFRRGERLAYASCYDFGRLQWSVRREDLLGDRAARKLGARDERELTARVRKLPCPLLQLSPDTLPEPVRRAIRQMGIRAPTK